MTLLGAFGILLGLLGWRFAFVERTRIRIGVFAVAFILHAAAAVFYYNYSITVGADASRRSR